MNKYKENVMIKLATVYPRLTNAEKVIADFFMNNKEAGDFSLKNLSRQLHVSETAFSRFAKKIDFTGYREFLYVYENFFFTEKCGSDTVIQVLRVYERMLGEFYNKIEEEQMTRSVQLLSKAGRVYVYGVGSSACAATEFEIRFMRLGLLVSAVSDTHIMRMNSVLMDENSLIIGISISGETESVISALKVAKSRRAKVILLTANDGKSLKRQFDEVILLPTIEHLSEGNNISPQFPVLVATDIIYSYFLKTDIKYKSALFNDTLLALKSKMPSEEDEEPGNNRV